MTRCEVHVPGCGAEMEPREREAGEEREGERKERGWEEDKGRASVGEVPIRTSSQIANIAFAVCRYTNG